MNFIKRKLYKIVFLQKHQNVLFVRKVVQTNSLKSIVSVDSKKFELNLENVSYFSKIQRVYFIDYVSGNLMLFKDIKAQLNPDELDLMIGQNIIKELTKGILDNKKDKIFWTLLGVVVGALIAVVVCMAIYNGKIQELIEQYTTVLPVIPTLPTSMGGF